MKKSLLLLTSLLTIGTTIAPVVTHEVNNQEQSLTAPFWWKKDHSNVLIENTYYKHVKTIYSFVYTTYIGDVNIETFKTASIPLDNDTYTKTSWGDVAYWGKKPSAVVRDISIKEFFSNTKIRTHGDILKHANIELLRVRESWGLAAFHSIQTIGFSYYYEDGHTYIQIFGVQEAQSFHSFSGGAMWTKIGSEIDLERA